MKIRELHVDGFGIHHDLSLELTPHLNVVQGPNEAGKSTLRDFVRSAFFGFPTGKSAVRREPLSGGRHGGRITLEAPDGSIRVVTLAPGRRRSGELGVTRRDGAEVSAEEWHSLLGGISRSYFENVHAFGLRELQELETLTGREMADYLFGGAVGMDPRRLARARKRLADRVAEILRPRGRSPLGDRIGELREVRKKLRDIRRQAGQVEEMQADRDRARAEIGEKERRRTLLDRDLAAHNRVLSVADDRKAWLDARRELADLDDVADFPLDAIEHHETLLRAHADAVRAVADAEEELRRARAAERAGRPDPAILGNAEGIQALGRLRDAVLRAQGQATAAVVARDVARRERDRRRAARSREREVALSPPIPAAVPVSHPASSGWGSGILLALAVTLGLLAWMFLDPEAAIGPWSLSRWTTAAGAATAVLVLLGIRRRVLATPVRRAGEAIGRPGDGDANGGPPAVTEEGPPAVTEDDDPVLAETEAAAMAAMESLTRAEAHLRQAVTDLLDRLPGTTTSDLAEVVTLDPGEAAARLAERVAVAQQSAVAHGLRLDEVDARDRRLRELITERERRAQVLSEIRSRAGADGEDAFLERATRARRRSALVMSLRTLEARIRQALRPLPEALLLLDEPEVGDPVALPEAETLDLAALDLVAVARQRSELAGERRSLQAALDALRENVGAKDAQIESVKGSDKLARLELEESRLVAEIEELAEEWRTLRVSQALLEEAALAFQRKHQPAVMRTASGFFERITGGEYRRVMRPLDVEAAPLLCEREGGELLPPEALSRGTREQLFLAIRFAVVRESCSGGAPLPVLMDDVLVNFDPARAARAIRVMAELARTHQILYFTCHPEVVARFREVEPGVAEYVLAG